MSEHIPIACTPGAIEEEGGTEARRRHDDISRRLLTRAVRKEQREDGLCFVFDADVETIALAGEFIARERLCCPFLGFRLEVDPRADAFRLVLSGDADVMAFLEAELLSKVPAP